MVKTGQALINPVSTIMSSPYATPNHRPVDRPPRYDQAPNVPDSGPGWTGVGVKMIFRIAQCGGAHGRLFA
jgi:hypothetical protein